MTKRDDVTGLVLAGGRGSRMGGVDKGLQSLRGAPMAMHVMLRLAPQVGTIIVNANRNIAAYEAFGAPVFPDVLPDYAGPLSGFLTGLEQSTTTWMATVPCDSPLFPDDLVARLVDAATRDDADIAMAACIEDGEVRTQPVFCLMRTMLLESLTRFTQGGGRKIDAWTAQHRTSIVTFPDAAAFANANTLQELQRLQ
jgi:molybdopterin-guanine dinucleotide biosynthesis protein A